MIRRAHDGWEVLRDGIWWAWSARFCRAVEYLGVMRKGQKKC